MNGCEKITIYRCVAVHMEQCEFRETEEYYTCDYLEEIGRRKGCTNPTAIAAAEKEHGESNE